MSVTYRFSNLLRQADIFGTRVPSFNLNGKKDVNTIFGGVLTSLILIVGIIFSSYKLEKLVTKHNPQFSTIPIEQYFSSGDRFYFNEHNFKVAISIEGKFDGKTRHDSRYGTCIAFINN